jgi:tetratricopeptide (TPR) repeat protein
LFAPASPIYPNKYQDIPKGDKKMSILKLDPSFYSYLYRTIKIPMKNQDHAAPPKRCSSRQRFALPQAKFICVPAILFLIVFFSIHMAAIAEMTDDYGDRIGTVNFPVSCSETSQRLMERGVALLHHMTYAGARSVFEATREADPDCALAHWGVAMTYVHPLWLDPPKPEELQLGLDLIMLAKKSGQKTAREHAYIAALEAYYQNGPERNHQARLASFEQAWGGVYREFPDDPEAAAFYALAHMATATSKDKSYQKQIEAGAVMEKLLVKIPDHPGAHHYIIHAYDFPGLADRALNVARNYGKVAPKVPHALHMPTHIFTRLGLWQESIDWNLRSAAAAWKNKFDGAITMHYLHALDYLAYAYLQQAQDEKAKEVLEIVLGLSGPFYNLNAEATAYALAAIPARYALERQRWAEAAKQQPRKPASFQWGNRFAAFEATAHYARALGAARSGNTAAAQNAILKMETLHKIVVQKNAYWASQVRIQQLSAQAWLAIEKGRQVEALRLMQLAADLETSIGKHPVTPGEVLPARELLGDMLLALKRPEEALVEYEKSLTRTPNRFNSLYGAGRSAELVGDTKKTAAYFQKLLTIAARADTERPRLQYARRFLKPGIAKRTP